MAFRLFVVTAMWLLCSAAPALTRAAPGSAERETARSLMRQGDQLSDAGDHPGALERYQSAHALMHVPTTGLAVAETQARLGQLVEARSSALEVVGMPVDPEVDEPAVFTHARTAAAELVAALEPRVCTIETLVTPSAADYSLQIDEVLLPEAARGVPFKTNPGRHVLHVKAPGYLDQTREIRLGEGAVQRVELTLQPLAASPAVAAVPETLTPAQAAYASQQLDSERDSGRVRGYIGLGGGGAALIAGTITGIMSWTQAQALSERCDAQRACAPAERDALQSANTLAYVANVALPLGLVGIAYGLYELLTLPDAAASSQAALRLQLAPNAIVLRGAM
jgi:hypothetical protein